MGKTAHGPKLPTGLTLEEKKVAALIRHLSSEVKVVKKGTHDPIKPNNPMIPKMRFVVLVHIHCCWMI